MKKLLAFIDNHLLFILIAVIAIMVRVFGNGYGLPDEFHTDEVHIVSRAIKFGSGDLNPHFFFYPALQMYIMFAVYGFYFVTGSLTGVFHSAAGFGMQYFIDPTMFYLLARTVSAVMGTATVLLAGAFAGRYYGRSAAAAAAILLALNYLHAEQSHYTTTDVPMTFWFMLCLYFAPGPGVKVSRRNFVLCGIFGGMAVATKYTAALLVPILFILYLLYYFHEKKAGAKPRGAGNFILLGCLFATAFLICAPYTILDFQTFRSDLAIQKRLLDFGWLGFENIGNMWWQILTVYLKESLGLPLLIITFPAVAYAAWKRKGADIALVIFLLAFYYINGKSAQVFTRYFVPAMPIVCILAGRLLADAASLFRNRAFEAACLAALMVSYLPAKNLMAFEQTLREKDTRTIAREFIERTIPPGARIAIDMTGPQLNPTIESVTDVARMARYQEYRVDAADPFFAWKDRAPSPEQVNTEKTFLTMALEKIDKKYYLFQPYSLAQYSLDLYKDEGFDYIIASSETYDRYYAARDTYPEAAAFYDSLNREAFPIRLIPQELSIRHGPEIKIYMLRKDK